MNYNANDIVSLSAGKAFRDKIGMYLSADRQEAINLGLRELIVNVQDEYEVYKPNNPYIKITLDSNKREICVEDNMRGIPVGIRDDGMNSLTAAFLIPHSGGKHQEGVYSSAVGVNGEGNKVVCHTAKWLTVEVKRDNKIYTQKFSSTDEGATALTPVLEEKDIKKPQITGTKIIYVPDERVYGNIFIDIPKLEQMLQELAYFAKGLKIILINDNKEKTFFSKNGLIDGLVNKDSLSKPFSYFYESDDCKVELALQWVAKKGEIRGYANGLYMPDGGAFISGFKSSLTRTFNSLADKKFDGDQIRNILDGYVSVKVKVGQFSNQAKTALANPEARTATSIAISNCLKEFFLTYKNDFNKIVDMLSRIEKAELAADKARKQVLEMADDVEKNQRRKVFASDKLKDAEQLGEQATLLIVEGKSAASSMATSRDEKHFGILSIKGKLINALSNGEEKLFDNEEIKLLLSAMNIIPGKYDNKKLRYGKIAICSDADSDGYHIGLLIMSALQYFAPEFIEENRLCWLRSPLWIVKTKKKEYYYYTDTEYQQSKIIGETSRVKGLGTLSSKQARDAMFSDEFQRLEVLKYDFEAIQLLTSLMGENVQFRKDYIFKNVDFSEVVE